MKKYSFIKADPIFRMELDKLKGSTGLSIPQLTRILGIKMGNQKPLVSIGNRKKKEVVSIEGEYGTFWKF